MTTICLIDESKSITGGHLESMAMALEANARHCAKAWGLEGPIVEPWKFGRTALRRGQWPLYFMDDTTLDPGALAVHYVENGRPSGRVYVGRGTGINIGQHSLFESASHEIVEMIINPYLKNWRFMPGRPGVQVALEVADPVQDWYPIDDGEETWKAANFVHPRWFGLRNPAGIPPDSIDHKGTLSKPGEIGPEGYAILLTQTGDIVYGGKPKDVPGVRSGRVSHEDMAPREPGK